MEINRGDVVITDFDPSKGSEQGSIRPSVVLQNDIGNRHSATTIVAPFTSSYGEIYPVNVEVEAEESCLDRDSVLLLNQVMTVSIEERIQSKIGRIPEQKMKEVDRALEISLGLD